MSTYTYDALNRVASVTYSMGNTTDQAVSFTYDSGTNGLGHLTGASDANHSLAWRYDALGRVSSKSQTVNGVTKTVGYSYTSGDLTTLTTPSGQTVTYGYNANHQIASVAVNGTTVLNNATYEPLGPVNGWTWGNATTIVRIYNADGAVAQISSNGLKSYSYDNALRITGITGNLARLYGYDAAGNVTSYSSMTATYNDAGRLQTVSNGSITETLVYNALGQRIETSGGAAGTVLYWSDEQGHLLGEYDGSGNLIEETVWLGDVIDPNFCAEIMGQIVQNAAAVSGNGCE